MSDTHIYNKKYNHFAPKIIYWVLSYASFTGLSEHPWVCFYIDYFQNREPDPGDHTVFEVKNYSHIGGPSQKGFCILGINTVELNFDKNTLFLKVVILK